MDPLDPESLVLTADDERLKRAILDSADDDVPPPGARAQVLAKLGATPHAGASRAASMWRASMGQKASALGLVVALGAIGIGTTITMSASTPFSSAPARDLAVPVVAPSDAASLVVDAPSEAASLTVPEPSVAVSALPSSSEEAPSVPPAPHGAPSRSPSSHAAKTTGTRGPESSDDSTLGRELARIAAARNALTEGDATRTLQLLDAYDAEFPRGTFSVEVSVLRIEALARAGRTDEAAQLGNRFLARYPEGVLARRVATTLRAVVPREPAKESKTDR